jgi:membrane fusion protein (multidrug efflux system)
LEQSAAEFRSGQAYKKNQILIGLDAREYSASLVAAKSEFQNLVIGVLPDLRLDYADAYAAWSKYAKGFNVTAPLVDLPQANNEAEQFFITGRGIVAAFYSVKNMEERLAKYTIGAPFDGVLTDASVTKGTLVRAGQKLGEYIDTRSYELALSVTPAICDLLEIGAPVSMTSREGGQDFFGTIARINQKVDQATQMVQVFVVSIDERLKEGMYLEAELPARTQALAIKLPRKLLVNESFIYVVRDSVLDLVLVDPVYFTPNDMVVTGIPENTAVVVKPVAGAYAGMLVQIYDEKATEQSDQNKQ